jgi:hypothetical protein
MACSSVRASGARVAGWQPGEASTDVIPRLEFENEILREEVRQLRAAVKVYSAVAERLSDRHRFNGVDFHGTI